MIDARKAAFDANKRFYETGIPCARGHLSKRYVSTGQCVDCQKRFSKASQVFSEQDKLELCPVHPEDAAAIKAYAAALWQARNSTIKPELPDVFNPINPATGVRFYDDPANANIAPPIPHIHK